MKKPFLFAVLACAFPIVAACSTETVVKKVPPPAGETPAPGEEGTTPPEGENTGTAIGPEGGQVVSGDVTLDVPAGALAEETLIKITKSEDPTPKQHEASTALYKFEPDGLKFKKAAKLTFNKVPAEAVDPTIGLKNKDELFDGQVTKVAGESVSTTLTVLSDAFVATHDCKDADGFVKASCKPLPAPADLDSGRSVGKFVLTGFEYWQWKKPDPYDGGNEVAWGYNGDGEPKTGVMPTDQARACMAESFKGLEAMLNDPPAELTALAAKGVKQFWFWNNDMTDAKSSVVVPKGNSELWLYEPTRADGGLIKWISSTERDGSCHLPTREDLITFAKACSAKPAKAACGSGK